MINEPSADAQDARDMSRLASGEDGALNDLMERHATRVFQFLVRSLGNEDDAADLAQETFVRVYRNRDRFDPGQKFSTWLYTIASNLVRNRYRWRTRHPEVSLDAEKEPGEGGLKATLPDAADAPDEELLKKERAETVRRAVAALAEEFREPLILAVYEGLPHAEIATVLNCSVKAVQMRIYRARQQLGRALKRLL